MRYNHWHSISQIKVNLEPAYDVVEFEPPPDQTYYRRSDLKPRPRGDKLVLVNGVAGRKRVWGQPKVESEAYWLAPDLILVRCRWFTKHYPGSTIWYFQRTPEGWKQRTANHKAVRQALQAMEFFSTIQQ